MAMQATTRAYVLSEAEGEAFWFAGALIVLKADGDQTEGRLAFMDQTVPGDYAVPRHIHLHDDEAWYLLAGEATFFCGDRQFTAGAGAWVFLPRGVEHADHFQRRLLGAVDDQEGDTCQKRSGSAVRS